MKPRTAAPIATVVLEEPDREGWVKRSLADGEKWLADPAADWNEGLGIAETQANLIEAAQLSSMREPTMRAVEVLRTGKPNTADLQAMIRIFISMLKPYRKRQQKQVCSST
jgi:hypothetical protein